MVASLLTTVLLFAMGLVPSFKLSNRRASMDLQASTLAMSALETARSANFLTLADSTRTVTIDGVTYTETVTVASFPSGITKTVRATIDWEWQEKDYSLFREVTICRIPRG